MTLVKRKAAFVILLGSLPALYATFGISACADSYGLAVEDASASDEQAASDQSAGNDTGLADEAATDASAEGAKEAGSSPFIDDFNRGDDATIGNGWVMKYPAAFRLVGQRVERRYPDATHDFVDNIVYRPVVESLLDVEVSIAVRFAGSAIGYAQVHARVQPSTVATINQLDSYLLFTDDSATSAVIARQHGDSSGYTSLGNITIAPALNAMDTFRLRLRVSGTADVAVHGWVERLNGQSTWDVVGEASAIDTSSAKITTAGTVGFSGGRPEVDGIYTYDNFTRTPL